ncbi:MAG: glycosyltransferase [Pseudomonadota bacterium]
MVSYGLLRSLPSLHDRNESRPPDKRPKLGEILVDAGTLTEQDRRRVLERQTRCDARFGEILLTNGLVSRQQLYAALSEQYCAPLVDLSVIPPDPSRISAIGAARCLRLGLLPLKRIGETLLIASSKPDIFEDNRAWLEDMFGPVRLVIIGESDLHGAVTGMALPELIDRAETRVPARESCRNLGLGVSDANPMALTGMLALILLALAYPWQAAQIATVAALLILAANTALKAAALVARLREAAQPPADRALSPVMARLPRVSVLVPLLREREIAAKLVARLSRIDYPRELLDIVLVVEADDAVTQDTLARLTMPAHVRAIVAPEGSIKTKPRALNYALDFCRGSIIGIYDAEDSPDPDQILRVVRRFHEGGSDLACVQAVLDFYNSRSNWLARCFAIEYAAWFRVILPGIVRLGFVTPLGGTSLFFRRDVLDALGGWDAHNVTEDADLGIRLARHGYRTEFIESVTQEEANARAWPWVKQRSRWLKGYAITWATHMRRPLALWRDLGAWKFLGVQLVLLGALGHAALAPLIWAFWLVPFGLPHPISPWLTPVSGTLLIVLLLSSGVISLTVWLYSVRAASHRHLRLWCFTVGGYFPLATLAAYRGLIDLVVRPHYWEKTQHGVFSAQDERFADARALPLLLLARPAAFGRRLFTAFRPEPDLLTLNKRRALSNKRAFNAKQALSEKQRAIERRAAHATRG